MVGKKSVGRKSRKEGADMNRLERADMNVRISGADSESAGIDNTDG